MLMQNMHTLLAQNWTGLGTIGEGEGFGPFNAGEVVKDGGKLAATNIISSIIGVMTLVGGIYFFFQLIVGALGWLSASGDKQKLTHAQERITQAAVGLLIVVGAYGIVGLVSMVLGFDILDIGTQIDLLKFP